MKTKINPTKKLLNDILVLGGEVTDDSCLHDEVNEMGERLNDAGQAGLYYAEDKRDLLDMLTDALDSAQMVKWEGERYEKHIKKLIARTRKFKVEKESHGGGFFTVGAKGHGKAMSASRRAANRRNLKRR